MLNNECIEYTKLLPSISSLGSSLPTDGVALLLGMPDPYIINAITESSKPSVLYVLLGDVSDEDLANARLVGKSAFCLDIRYVTGDIISTLYLFPDNYFDWIYQDSKQDYHSRYSELEILASKLCVDGLLCGHDFIVGNISSGLRYGVIEAVYDFCSKYHWALKYLTIEAHGFWSFALCLKQNS